MDRHFRDLSIRRLVSRYALLIAMLIPACAAGHAGATAPTAPVADLRTALPSSSLDHAVTAIVHPLVRFTAGEPPNRRIYEQAAARSGVPVALLLAVSYVQSFWNGHHGQPSVDGGYGLMDLVRNPERDTLDAAARVLRVPASRVSADDALNVLGGALLLAREARHLSPRHALPSTLSGWAPAIVWLTGMRTQVAATAMLHDVYSILQHGVAVRGRSDRTLVLSPLRGVQASTDQQATRSIRPLTALGSAGAADYPGAIWAPSPNDTAASRPSDLGVHYVVVHDTEGGCAASLNWLASTASGASAHFLVCQDGTVYQLVHIHDIAWHAGNWYINQHSIGIEHEGFRDLGGYTQAQYDASAAIVRWLMSTYGLFIAPDRNAIYGHENVPNATHTDPGPLWDWSYYMSRIRGIDALDSGDPSVAMIATGQATLRSCAAASCSAVGTANWGEQFAAITTTVGSAPGWEQVYYNGGTAWLNAADAAAGAGTRLTVTAPTLNVRDAPGASGTIIGSIPAGQVYVSRLLDTALDPSGWWLIAYNHRYGFVSSRYVQAAPASPTITPMPAVSVTVTPSVTITPSPVPTVTPILTATVTPTVAAAITTTPSITPTSVLPATPATQALLPSPTAARHLPAATAVRTPPSPRPSPTATPRPQPLRLRALAVTLTHLHVLAGTRLPVRVHTNVGGAQVQYRLDLPGGVILRAAGRTDQSGNAVYTFTLPGKQWLAVLVRTLPRQASHSVLPHSVAARYTVRGTWRNQVLVRSGLFRVVLWKPV